MFGPIIDNTLQFTDSMTLGLKFREKNPAMQDESYPTNDLVSFDRNIAREYSQQIDFGKDFGDNSNPRQNPRK